MGLFFKKKKEEKKIEGLPPLPSIPKFEPKPMPSLEMPSYEPTLSNIKKEIDLEPSKMDLGIPFRRPDIITKKPLIEEKPMEIREKSIMKGEKSIFIKIDKYRDALKMIDDIKAKIEDAEKTVSELESLKDTEQKNIESWKSDLNEIKSKLLNIDKNLFEV